VIVGAVVLLLLAVFGGFHHREVINNGQVTYHFYFSGVYFILVLLGALYPAFMIGLLGQTLGMMVARIKAVDATTGGLIGFWRALGRDLFERLLQFLLVIPVIIDLLFPAWDPRRQTLHDKVTNTVVIKL